MISGIKKVLNILGGIDSPLSVNMRERCLYTNTEDIVNVIWTLLIAREECQHYDNTFLIELIELTLTKIIKTTNEM